MMDTRELAKDFAGSFEVRKRDNGEEFVCLKSSAPDWVCDLVRDAHTTDMLPDDTRYSMILECADKLTECDPDQWEDCAHEMADSMVDVYNIDRARWLASHVHRAFYCDDARAQGLVSEDADMFTRIGAGQYHEYSEILRTLITGLTERAEEEENRMDRDAFEAYFRADILPVIQEQYESDGSPDYPARREAWNDTLDAMDRDGLLQSDCDEWEGLPDDLDA